MGALMVIFAAVFGAVPNNGTPIVFASLLGGWGAAKIRPGKLHEHPSITRPMPRAWFMSSLEPLRTWDQRSKHICW
jgi:hypothetical protein